MARIILDENAQNTLNLLLLDFPIREIDRVNRVIEIINANIEKEEVPDANGECDAD